jgi:hypothetical protein
MRDFLTGRDGKAVSRHYKESWRKDKSQVNGNAACGLAHVPSRNR